MTPVASASAPADVLRAFDNIRRAQRAGVYAPHKPLLVLLALARVQRGEPRLVAFTAIDSAMKMLLSEFGPSSAAATRHYPFWHLATDGVWELPGPRALLDRAPGATPTLGELRRYDASAGFPARIDSALRDSPGLLHDVATRVLDTYFPTTLHADIAAAVGLDLEVPDTTLDVTEAAVTYTHAARRRRDPAFRERVLRAYEYRCYVCGFDLRIGHIPAGLEAAHIQWHHVGGPDIEPNGLALCALHHKLFDLGAFTIEPEQHRIVFSQHAITAARGSSGELQYHGRQIYPPQHVTLRPGLEYLRWNTSNVFKKPERPM